MTYSQKLLDEIQNHNFSNTNILLKKALDNDTPEILASLADNLTDLGFTDLAKEVYRALIAQFPEEDLFKVYLGEILLNDGNEDDGLSLLYGIDENSDAYIESLLAQADYYQSNGLIETARQKLLQAHKFDPDEDAIIFGLAELAYSAGNYSEALENYKKLFDHQKTFGEVVLSQRIAASLAQLGEYEEAAKVIQENENDLLTIDSQYEAGLILLSAGKNKKAIEFLDRVIENQPDYVNAYPLLAKAYENEGDTEQVLQACETGLTYNEFDETLYSLGAKAATKINDLDKAEHLLEKGLKIAPDNSDLRLQLSNLYLHTNQDKKNIDLFGELDSDDIEPQAHWNLALSFQRMENYDKAKSEFLLAYPSFQENPDFLKQMLTFFREIADNKTTIALLEKYLKLVPEDTQMQALYDELNNNL